MIASLYPAALSVFVVGCSHTAMILPQTPAQSYQAPDEANNRRVGARQANKLPESLPPLSTPALGAVDTAPQLAPGIPADPGGSDSASPPETTLLDRTKQCAHQHLGKVMPTPPDLVWYNSKSGTTSKRDWRPPKGSIAIVNLWESWCPPCREEMPLLLQLGKHLGDGLRPSLVLISQDTGKDAIQRFQEKSGLKFDTFIAPTRGPLLALSDAAGDLPELPLTLIVDSAGRIRGCVYGRLDAQKVDDILHLIPLLK